MTPPSVVMSDAVHDSAHFRRTLSCFPVGVTVVAAADDAGAPIGMVVNSFTSVSLDPPLVAVCMATASSTWPSLRQRLRLGISVLAADQTDVCRALTGPASEHFRDVSWRATDQGAVLVDGAVAWLDGEIDAELTSGDHDIVVVWLHAMGGDPDRRPLVVHGGSWGTTSPFGHELSRRTA